MHLRVSSSANVTLGGNVFGSVIGQHHQTARVLVGVCAEVITLERQQQTDLSSSPFMFVYLSEQD